MSVPRCPSKAGHRRWTCPYCRRRFAARSQEDPEQFAARCGAHQRSRLCGALDLADRLGARELERLIGRTGDFLEGHAALKEAGLVETHRTRLVEPDSLRPEPWAPIWAIEYERYLRRKPRRPFSERVAELRAAAESPESVERARAFLALVDKG